MYLVIALILAMLGIAAVVGENDRPMKAPRRPRWGGFVHLLARFYQNYEKALLRAARRKRNRAVDIDGQHSVEETLWGLHWPTVGRNKLHDPRKIISKNTRIDFLTDKQIGRLRGPNGQKPHSMAYYLERAAERGVRVEVELKSTPDEQKIRNLLARENVAAMNARGDLQFKTLAFIGAPDGPVNRLRPVHEAGGTTILSFTGFSAKKKPISKHDAWPVTDYVRGRARWAD